MIVEEGVYLGIRDVDLHKFAGTFSARLGEGRVSVQPDAETAVDLTELLFRGSAKRSHLMRMVLSPGRVHLRATCVARLEFVYGAGEGVHSGGGGGEGRWSVDEHKTRVHVSVHKEVSGAASLPDNLVNVLADTILSAAIPILMQDALPEALGQAAGAAHTGALVHGRLACRGECPGELTSAALVRLDERAEVARE